MVHGGAGHGRWQRCSPGGRTAGENTTPARLDEGVVPPAMLKALELHGPAERCLGGPGTPGASHRLPTSSSTSAQRPCRLPREVFQVVPQSSPSRPGLLESSAVAPRGCQMHRSARSRWDPTGCAPRSWEEAQSRGARCAPGSRPEPRLQAARRSRGVGRRAGAAEEGGDWRREREEGRGAGDRTRVGGRCALQEGGRVLRGLPHLASGWRPYPFSSRPPRGGRSERPSVWDLRDSGKDACRRGRVGACGDPGGRVARQWAPRRVHFSAD